MSIMLKSINTTYDAHPDHSTHSFNSDMDRPDPSATSEVSRHTSYNHEVTSRSFDKSPFLNLRFFFTTSRFWRYSDQSRSRSSGFSGMVSVCVLTTTSSDQQHFNNPPHRPVVTISVSVQIQFLQILRRTNTTKQKLNELEAGKTYTWLG